MALLKHFKESSLAQKITCMDQKVSFWQFFRKGLDGCALLVQCSKTHHSILKIIFDVPKVMSFSQLEAEKKTLLWQASLLIFDPSYIIKALVHILLSYLKVWLATTQEMSY